MNNKIVQACFDRKWLPNRRPVVAFVRAVITSTPRERKEAIRELQQQSQQHSENGLHILAMQINNHIICIQFYDESLDMDWNADGYTIIGDE